MCTVLIALYKGEKVSQVLHKEKSYNLYLKKYRKKMGKDFLVLIGLVINYPHGKISWEEISVNLILWNKDMRQCGLRRPQAHKATNLSNLCA